MDIKATRMTMEAQTAARRHGLPTRRALATLAVAAGLLLQASARAGGGAGGKPVVYRGEAEALFAQDGRPTASALKPPPDFPWLSRDGLYATAEQVSWQALNAENYTVVVDLDGHRPARKVLAETVRVHRWSLEHGPQDFATAYFVQAASVRRAVAAADKLTAAGLPFVFVVIDKPRAMEQH